MLESAYLVAADVANSLLSCHFDARLVGTLLFVGGSKVRHSGHWLDLVFFFCVDGQAIAQKHFDKLVLGHNHTVQTDLCKKCLLTLSQFHGAKPRLFQKRL